MQAVFDRRWPLSWLLLFSCPLLVAAEGPADWKTLKKNGGWCWFQDERALVDGRQVIFGSVAGTTRDGSEAGDIVVTRYDFDNGTAASFELHDRLQCDDHNVPALLRLPDGRLLATYTKHGSDRMIRYRVTESPGDITAWGPLRLIEMPAGVTYTNLHYLGDENDGKGRLYNFSRAAGTNPNWMVSDDSAQSWKYGGEVFDWPGRPYVKYASDGRRTIHLITTDAHPINYSNSIYHGYLRDGVLHDSFGNAISRLDSGPMSDKQLTRVFPGDPHHVAWTIDLHLDAEGHPVIAFSVQKDGASFSNSHTREGPGWDHRYYYGRFDGKKWHVHEMAYAGTGLYAAEADYTGLVAIDPHNVNTVYISADVHPVTGLPNVSAKDNRRHYEIFRGRTPNDGKDWVWEPVTTDSPCDNLRPIIPIGRPAERIVLWTRGTLTTFTDYDLDVVGFTENR